MKTITTREFFHSPGLVSSLHAGQSLVVTDNGKPNFVVTKAGNRPRKTLADLNREARSHFKRKLPKTDYVQYLIDLKK